MKKIITITSLFAAGTALANADAVSLSADFNFENELKNSGTVSVTGTASGTDPLTYIDSVAAGTLFGNYKVESSLGQALSLAGTDYVILGNAAWSNGANKLQIGSSGTSFTFMSYVKLSSTSGEIGLFGTGDGNGYGIGFGFQNGKLDLLAKGSAHHTPTSTTTTTFVADTWYHIAISYDSTTGTATYYVNGEKDGEKTGLNTAGFISPGGAGAAIGSWSKDTAQATFSGAIDKLQIANTVLTADQIRSTAGLGAVPEPSAFGLLAGVGALAFVAARRRRRKVA